MQSQSANMIERKERIKRLLAILDSVIDNNPEYEKYVNLITKIIKEIQDENIILSLTDYNKAINVIKKEKEGIDKQIALIKGQAAELQYEDAVKKIGLIEHLFIVLNQSFDIVKYGALRDEIAQLKKEIKELKVSFDRKEIITFNNNITNLYLNSDLNIKHLDEDRQSTDFSLEFMPFKLCLFAKNRDENGITTFIPGSMARQTHLQILVYLCMFEYLKKNFHDFIYMPLLILDSANQPMGTEIFQEVYPMITSLAKNIGIQTIFLSKDRIEGIADEDFIDISEGLNKFHIK